MAQVMVRVNIVDPTTPTIPAHTLSADPDPAPVRIWLTSSSPSSNIKVVQLLSAIRINALPLIAVDLKNAGVGQPDPRHSPRELRHLRLSVGAAGQHPRLPRPGESPLPDPALPNEHARTPSFLWAASFPEPEITSQSLSSDAESAGERRRLLPARRPSWHRRRHGPAALQLLAARPGDRQRDLRLRVRPAPTPLAPEAQLAALAKW
jgi:hypothetical protein